MIVTIKKESINSDLCKKYGDKINIVYTPLNGTGNVLVRRVLKEMGFTNVHVVEEQEKPDENFTTVPKPNPSAAGRSVFWAVRAICSGASS